VFEIGSSLRAAREQRGLRLADIERATRIRSRYLQALEEERFDLIPGVVYARGFLRTYADHLGLDGERFVDELGSRLTPDEHDAPVPAPRPFQRRRFRLPMRRASIGIGVLLLAGGLVWLLDTTGGPSRHTVREPPPTRPGPARVANRPAPQHRPPQDARLVLRATRGRCWLEAHAGSATGRVLYMNTLEQGQSLSLTQKRIWIRLGAPTALNAILNGRPISLPPGTPENVVVRPTGVHVVA